MVTRNQSASVLHLLHLLDETGIRMSEVLMEFAELVLSKDRTPYRARAYGGVMSDGLWEGWIEFIPLAGGAHLRSPRETTQPNRVDTLYCATGLTPVYLEGALVRAIRNTAATER